MGQCKRFAGYYRVLIILLVATFSTTGMQCPTIDGDEKPVPTAPTLTSFSINNGAQSTTSRTVTLNNTCTGSPSQYMASELSSFSGASWQAYSAAPSFVLSSGSGTKTVYFKVRNAAGESPPTSASINVVVADPYAQLRAAVAAVGNRPVIVDNTVRPAQGGVPIGVGCGVKLNKETSSYQFATGKKLFNYDRQTLGTHFDTGTNDPRYNYLSGQSWKSRYLSSYAEELDFKSCSLSAQGRYAAYNGGISWGQESQKYNSSKHHEIALKVHYDYGWFALKSNPVLDDTTLQSLQGNGFNAYGTHYVLAEHRMCELYVNIAADTTNNISTDEMSATAEASYNSVTSAASLKGAIDAFRKTMGSSVSVTVSLSAIGGPPIQLQLENGADLKPMVDAINGWISSCTTDSSGDNAASVEFYCRPLTDLVPGSAYVGDFFEEQNLTNWFIKFSEVDTALKRIASILNFTEPPTMKQEFSYYDGPFSAAHYAELYTQYRSVRAKLVTQGKALLNDPSIGFDPYDSQWQLPSVEFPALYVDFYGLPQHIGPSDDTSMNFNVRVIGGNFSTGRYLFSVDTNCCNCRMVSVFAICGVSDYDPATNSQVVCIYASFDYRCYAEQVINSYRWGEYRLVLTDTWSNKELLRVYFHNPPRPMGNCSLIHRFPWATVLGPASCPAGLGQMGS